MSKKSSYQGTTMTRTGLTKESVANYKASGDLLSTTNQAPSALQTKSIYYTDIPTLEYKNNGSLDEIYMGDPNDIATLTDVFNRRISAIKEKQTRPGLMMTRGEK
jgi:hypothetical protein